MCTKSKSVRGTTFYTGSLSNKKGHVLFCVMSVLLCGHSNLAHLNKTVNVRFNKMHEFVVLRQITAGLGVIFFVNLRRNINEVIIQVFDNHFWIVNYSSCCFQLFDKC